jgi:hypothetical protein
VSFVGQPDSDIISTADTVSPGFFETLGVPLKAGRYFTWRDSAPTARVCILSESLARKLDPNGDGTAAAHSLRDPCAIGRIW